MGKKTKKKKSTSLVKRLGLIGGIFAFVIIVSVIAINAINKTTIKTITVEGAYTELYIGNPEFSSSEIGISVYPETASKSSLMAYSENPNIAKVNFDGEKLSVEAVGVGTTTIVVRHANKSSLNDTIQINVKDVDVQSLTFVEKNIEDGSVSPVSSVSIKKDGFKHYIPFELDPIDANMNNLKINDFNTVVFESVEIDPVTRSVVVVPKTDIIQTSAEIDVEIYQNTIEGYSSVQVVSLMVDLLNREAYIRFNLSSNHDSDREYITLDSNELNNIVYIEPSETATTYLGLSDSGANYVYVLPQIGYDVNFNDVGSFNISDYDLYFDGVKVNDSDYNSSGFYTYENKLVVNKSKGDCYKFNSLKNFSEKDCVFVEFKHKYTGAGSGLQFMSLKKDSLGLDSNQSFSVKNLTSETNYINIGEVLALDFSYDACVELGMVEIYSYTVDVINGEEIKVITNEFNNSIRVEKSSKKLSVWAYGLNQNINIKFGIRCSYWDSRYVYINENVFTEVTFSVVTEVKGMHVEVDGKETNIIELSGVSPVKINIVSEPEGGIINQEDVEISASEINVAYNSETKSIEISKNNAAAGTYKVTFTYNETMSTDFYVVVR